MPVLASRLAAVATLMVCLSSCTFDNDDAPNLGLEVSEGVNLGFQAREVGSLAVDGLCVTDDEPVELLSVEALSAGQDLRVTDFDVVSVPDDSFADQAKPLDNTGWSSLDGRVTSKCGDAIQTLGLEMSKTTDVGRAESMRFTYRIGGKEQTQTVPFDVTLCTRIKDC